MENKINKKELIKFTNENYEKINNIINSLSPEEQTAPFNFQLNSKDPADWYRDKNIRDVLTHLYEWQEMLLNWIFDNQKGQSKSFLPKGYNWQNYGELNQKIWEKYQNTSFKKARELLAESHQAMIELINTFSNPELFTKNIYPWAENNTLGSYFIDSGASHYAWALKKLKKYQNNLKNNSH